LSEVDNDSVDWGIAAGGEAQTPRRPRLELQLKCTAQAPVATDAFPFELKIKNYNELRVGKLFVPRILVVVTVPAETEQWLELSGKQLILRHSACWLSLCGAPETENESTITIQIARSQYFTPEALRAMMQRMNDGGLP
jgi:hypothetical protein